MISLVPVLIKKMLKEVSTGSTKCHFANACLSTSGGVAGNLTFSGMGYLPVPSLNAVTSKSPSIKRKKPGAGNLAIGAAAELGAALKIRTARAASNIQNRGLMASISPYDVCCR
jgi:hypothetical protein